MLCQNGCGEEATYVTKTLKHICNKNAGKCKALNPKGKAKTSRRPAAEYSGELLCEFCNIHRATHILVNGKRCCSSTAGNCKEVRKAAGKKISESRNYIDPNTGVKNSVRIARKVAEIKANNIDESGLNSHQRAGIKYKQWLHTTAAGHNRLQTLSDSLRAQQAKVDPITGLTEAKRRARLAVDTKIADVNELGLNGFEQSHWKAGKNTGFINGIFWQYKNERRFLERAILNGTIDKVRRGPAIPYCYGGTVKRYMPDYIIENTIYEIKSTYTMFGPNNQYLQKNVAKLLATEEAGYEVYVVIDDKTMSLPVFINSISNLLE